MATPMRKKRPNATGPDPVECAKNFSKLQKLYDKSWEALKELGTGHKTTQTRR